MTEPLTGWIIAGIGALVLLSYPFLLWWLLSPGPRRREW